MWLGLYISDNEAAGMRQRLGDDLAFLSLRTAVHSCLAGPNPLDGLEPGGLPAERQISPG